MNITSRQVGSLTVLSVSGKVTLEHAGQLKEKVASLLADGHKRIVLDLGGVTYIDSSGLGEMVSCHTAASRQDGTIRLANLGKKSRDLLVMTKLIMVFSVYDTEAEAIASFAEAV
ncbi:MAG TPA: STAS domain-containing protein [Vicinamibacterales bacterium]|nr:STAS domain-containing protein [Vicinamibacterales bacterium]